MSMIRLSTGISVSAYTVLTCSTILKDSDEEKKPPVPFKSVRLGSQGWGLPIGLLNSKHKADIVLSWAVIPVKTELIKHC